MCRYINPLESHPDFLHCGQLLLETFSMDYMRTAPAKGLGEFQIIKKKTPSKTL